MYWKTLLAAATSAALSLPSAAAFAGADDYIFEPVQAELTKGDDVTVAVRLLHKPTGKPVADAVIFRTRIDMGPDGMAEMVSPVIPLPAKEPGTYAFKTDLPMTGRYLFSIAAKVQGEPETGQQSNAEGKKVNGTAAQTSQARPASDNDCRPPSRRRRADGSWL